MPLFMDSSLLVSHFTLRYIHIIYTHSLDFYGLPVANSWAPGGIKPQVGTLRCGAILKLFAGI